MRTSLGIVCAVAALVAAQSAPAAFPGRNGRLLYVRVNPFAADWMAGISGYELRTVRPDGSGAQLLAAPGVTPEAQWSPDGTRVAFGSDCANKYDLVCGEIAIVDAADRNVRAVTHIAERVPSGLDEGPTWSPDGTRLAFTRYESPAGVFTIGADGSGERKLFDYSYSSAAWSPDGTRLAFWRSFSGRSGAVFVAGVDGTGVHEVASTRLPTAEPDWSPGGTKLAFTRATGRTSSICVVAVTGGAVTCLARGAQPAWSPDGRWIAFDRFSDIYVMRADGTQVRNVTRTPHGVEFAPDWQPRVAG